MTDDAYLFLLDDASAPLGVAPAAVGDLPSLETPAVHAWPAAQGSGPASPDLRLLPPEERAAVPEGAERLPLRLSDEELNRVRHAMAPESLARVEEELLAYRDYADGRDGLIGGALAAGVPPHRVVELTGVDPATVTAAENAAASAVVRRRPLPAARPRPSCRPGVRCRPRNSTPPPIDRCMALA